jgi:hypothetical protein
MSDVRDLSVFLESYKLDAYIDALVEKDYTIDNLHLLTASDLNKLRITNKKDRSCLLGAVNILRDEQNCSPHERMKRRQQRLEAARPYKRNIGPEERRRLKAREEASRNGNTTEEPASGICIETLADGTVVMNTVAEAREIPEFSATIPTANEAARQATIFLCHHRVDRPWPKPGSKLSQTLHLSNASPPSYAPLYTINKHGETSVVEPPQKVSQGFQARFCPTCCDYVNESMQGAWQFQIIERVLVGEDQYEDVPVWKPFTQTESMKIEYSHKRGEPTVKIRKTMVDFDGGQWGTKPIRRVESDAVAFPTLKKGDLTPVPKKQIEPQAAIAANIQDLHRTLISETEENRSRLFISQQQDKALLQVLLEIAGIMDEYHFQQRRALEEEETEARAKFEGPEFDAALDKLYEFEEQSVRDVALRKWEKESAKILQQQCGLLEEMESVARQDVANEEASFRKNLDKLVKLFNDTIRDHLDRIRKKELRNQKNSEGQPRCPICRKIDCDFFSHPWRAAFGKHPESKRLTNTPDETLSTLANRANEKEYNEYMLNVKAKRKESRAKKRLMQHVTNTSWGQRPGLPVGSPSTPPPASSPIPGGIVNESVSSPQPAPSGGVEGAPDDGPPRPHSAASLPTAGSVARSLLRPSSATPFRNAVGPGHNITADSINKLSKRAPTPSRER